MSEKQSIVHENDPSRELLYLPAGSSIFPPDMAVLWQIVQAVDEEDSTFYSDNDGLMHCPFCYTSTSDFHQFRHQPDCIVTKARELMEWRKAQPMISIK